MGWNPEEEATKLHENVILIAGFLGAIAFAGLVLIVQSPSFILDKTNIGGMPSGSYLNLVVGLLGFTVILSGIAVVASLSVLVESRRFSERGLYWAQYIIECLMIAVFILFIVGVFLVIVPLSVSVATDTLFLSLSVAIVVFGTLTLVQRRL